MTNLHNEAEILSVHRLKARRRSSQHELAELGFHFAPLGYATTGDFVYLKADFYLRRTS